MKYVLDASVALKWVLTEHDSPKAIDLRDRYSRRLHELIGPDVFALEVAHALTRAERRGIIKVPQGMACMPDVMTTPPHLFPSLPLLSRAFAIASQMRVGIYDCLYVALAEREACEFVTADDKF